MCMKFIGICFHLAGSVKYYCITMVLILFVMDYSHCFIISLLFKFYWEDKKCCNNNQQSNKGVLFHAVNNSTILKITLDEFLALIAFCGLVKCLFEPWYAAL